MLSSTKKAAPKVRKDMEFTSRHGGDAMIGDILGEDVIDGKPFWIVQVGARTFKLSKEGYELKGRGR